MSVKQVRAKVSSADGKTLKTGWHSIDGIDRLFDATERLLAEGNWTVIVWERRDLETYDTLHWVN